MQKAPERLLGILTRGGGRGKERTKTERKSGGRTSREEDRAGEWRRGGESSGLVGGGG